MTTQSTRFRIAQALFEALQPVAEGMSAQALFNPKLPIDPRGRPQRLLFVLDRGDKLLDQPGQRERRRARLVLGALVFSATPDAEVDALHFAARAALKGGVRQALAALGAPVLREVEVEPEIKEVATEGALLLSAFEAEFIETYPAA